MGGKDGFSYGKEMRQAKRRPPTPKFFFSNPLSLVGGNFTLLKWLGQISFIFVKGSPPQKKTKDLEEVVLQNSKKNRHTSEEYFASLEGKTAEKLHLKINATKFEKKPIDPKGEKKGFVTFRGGGC